MKKKTTLSFHKLFLPLVVAGFSVPASAEVAWINPDGGEFHDPANWDGETIPGEEDVAAFNDIDAAYEVQFTEDAAIGELLNRGGHVTFDLGGNSLSVAGRVNFDAANSAGETTFRNGNLSSQQISLGGEGEEGVGRSLVLEGPDLFWEASGHMGIGTTQGLAGPSISNHSVTIRDGAEVNLIGAGNGGGVILGWEGGSNNSFRITGPGSKITMRNMVYVGYQRSGHGNSVYVEDGAWLSSNGIQIGRGGTHDQQEALLILDGADSRIDAAFIQLGGGSGVGDNTLSTGNVLEQRDGLLWLDPDQGSNPNTYLYVASAGNHVRLLGGTTRVERPVERIGYARSVAGSSITVAGGNLITDNLRISNATDTSIIFHHGSITTIDATYAVASAPLIVGDGESAPAIYRMNGGNHVFGENSGLIVESNGEVTGFGNLEGNVTVRGAFGPDGEIAFNSGGSLTFDGGKYTARLNSDTFLFGNTGVEFDFANGTLEVAADTDFSALVGTTFLLIRSYHAEIPPFSNAAEGTILSAGNGVFVEISYSQNWGEMIATVVEPQGETFADWAARHDLGTDVSPENDPAGDGIANAIKYALGLNPNLPTVLPEATLVEENGEQYLTLAVERDPSAIEATLAAESSPDLVDWSPETVAVENGPGDLVTFRDTVPVGSADRRFLRLAVSVD